MKQSEAARSAVQAYADRVPGEAGEPFDTQAADLIADVLGACENPDHVLRRALLHFEVEYRTPGYVDGEV